MSRSNFATITDVTTLFRTLTTDETTKATNLLPVVSDRLRYEAIKNGKNLDEMVMNNPILATVAKQITVDVVARALMTPTTAPSGGPMSQYSESALGYSVSGTFLNPGGGLFIKRDELKALGITGQKVGVIDLC